MERWKRWIWPAAIAAVVLAALLYAYWPQPVPVDIAGIEQGPMQVTVEDDAVTRVKEVFVVSAPIPGRTLRIEQKVGDDAVADKTVVARILPTAPPFLDARTQREMQARLATARAARDLSRTAVKGAEARLAEAVAEQDRTRRLFQSGHVAKARLDRAEAQTRSLESDLDTARAAIRQQEFEIKTVEAALLAPTELAQRGADGRCCYDVRSPVSGKILRLLRESEGVVAAGTPLVEIGDPADLEVVLDLLSADAVKVVPGGDVVISRWGGEGTLKGRVRRVEPFGVQKISALGIEEQRVNVIIDLVDPRERWARLGHGYEVDAAVVLWRSENAIQVPVGALFRDGDDWAVFRVEGGRAQLTKLKLGHMNDDAAEILQGLKKGDRVVAHPSDRVQDGVSVAPR